MKVAKIYVDLKESKQQKKNGKDVRVLESEAFKDPIEMDIVFDEEEKTYFKLIKDNCEEIYQQIKESLNDIKERQKIFEKYKITTEEEINEKDKAIVRLKKENLLQQTKIKQLISEIETVKEAIIWQDKEISSLTAKINQISFSVNKKPVLEKQTIFLSGVGESVLYPVNLEDGEYTLFFMGNIKEKNEYCTNKNSFIQIDEIHVKNGVRLQPYDVKGTTDIDIPTLTLNYTLFFIPK